MAIQGAHAKNRQITPHLIVRDAEEACAFYRSAFGAVELYRSPLPGGSGLHVHLRIGETMVMVTSAMGGCSPSDAEEEQAPFRPPQDLGGTSVVLEILVDDADAMFARATSAGGKEIMPVSDAFWGDRYGMLVDPFGHVWGIATIKEILTPKQMEERIAAMGAAH